MKEEGRKGAGIRIHHEDTKDGRDTRDAKGTIRRRHGYGGQVHLRSTSYGGQGNPAVHHEGTKARRGREVHHEGHEVDTKNTKGRRRSFTTKTPRHEGGGRFATRGTIHLRSASFRLRRGFRRRSASYGGRVDGQDGGQGDAKGTKRERNRCSIAVKTGSRRRVQPGMVHGW